LQFVLHYSSHLSALQMTPVQPCCNSKVLSSKRSPHGRFILPPHKFTRKESAFILPFYATSPSSTASSFSSSRNNSGNGRLTAADIDNKSNNNNNEDQIEAIQMIFTNYCDADGLMTKADVQKVPYIADLLVRHTIFPQKLV
jgi:hypothetical protein